MYRARDVMTTDVISVLPQTSIEAAIRILLEHSISGVPVVDAFGLLRGIVSEYQLIEVLYDPEIKTAPVSSVMTKDVLTVTEDTLLTDAASLFVLHRIRWLPVVRGEELAGVISRRDLLRYAIESGQAAENFVREARSVVHH